MKIKDRKNFILFRIFSYSFLGLGIYYSFDSIINYFQNNTLKILLNTIGWPLITICHVIAIYYCFKLFSLAKNRKLTNSDDLTIKLKERLINDEAKQDKDIINLMIENMVEIREYFNISKKQAKYSFFFAVGTTIAGLILFVTAIFFAVVHNELSASIITAISGSITEIISIVALKIYKDAQKQLNYYYDSLHSNEQYLSTISLVSKLSEEKQDDAYMSIINKYLNN